MGFEKELLRCNSKDEVRSVFKKNGKEISDTEVEKVINGISKIVAEVSKLSNDEMEEVSGGAIANCNWKKTRCSKKPTVKNRIQKIWAGTDPKTKGLVQGAGLMLAAVALYEGASGFFKKKDEDDDISDIIGGVGPGKLEPGEDGSDYDTAWLE